MATALLATIICIGFIAAGTTQVVRAVAPQEWLLHKPFSCDLCMSWWSSFVMTAVVHVGEPKGFGFLVGSILGGVAISVFMLKATNRIGE